MAFDVKKARLSPASVFDRPAAVLSAPGLSMRDRKAILEQWKLDAERLEESANEAMGGGEPSFLAEVNKALNKLEQA